MICEKLLGSILVIFVVTSVHFLVLFHVLLFFFWSGLHF